MINPATNRSLGDNIQEKTIVSTSQTFYGIFLNVGLSDVFLMARLGYGFGGGHHGDNRPFSSHHIIWANTINMTLHHCS